MTPLARTILLGAALLAPVLARAEPPPALRLAVELDATGDHAAAAVEFRRLAAAAPAQESAAYYWMAGRAYLLRGDAGRAVAMLDRMDEVGPALRPLNSLLRAEVARERGDAEEARFYYESFLGSDPADGTARLARFRLSELHARAGRLDEATGAVGSLPDNEAALQALAGYRRGRDKSPTVGGLLGMVPGAGYLYSGEIANGVRSLILNGLFIWGMTAMAEEENWGGFAVITFFELTWYSGSIYGGVDAAHRHNRDRLERLAEGLGRGAALEPDAAALPALKLSVRW